MNFRESLQNKKYDSNNDIKNKINNDKETLNNTTSQNNFNSNEFMENINKYSNYSHNELMNEFIKKTARLKQSGQLNEAKVKEIYNYLEPMLNDEQKNNLKNLLKII